jgi:hypothetical protein
MEGRKKSREGESTVGSDALSVNPDTKHGIGWRTENKFSLGKGAK